MERRDWNPKEYLRLLCSSLRFLWRIAPRGNIQISSTLSILRSALRADLRMDKVEIRRLVMRKSESNVEKNSRRRFIKTAAAGAMAAGSLVRGSGLPKRFVLEPEHEAEQQVSANDRI